MLYFLFALFATLSLVDAGGKKSCNQYKTKKRCKRNPAGFGKKEFQCEWSGLKGKNKQKGGACVNYQPRKVCNEHKGKADCRSSDKAMNCMWDPRDEVGGCRNLKPDTVCPNITGEGAKRKCGKAALGDKKVCEWKNKKCQVLPKDTGR